MTPNEVHLHDRPLGAVDPLPPPWVRLARLALELDELAHELAAEPLTEADEDLLALPARHLELAYDLTQDVLYTLAKWGQSPWPPKDLPTGPFTAEDHRALIAAERRDLEDLAA